MNCPLDGRLLERRNPILFMFLFPQHLFFSFISEGSLCDKNYANCRLYNNKGGYFFLGVHDKQTKQIIHGIKAVMDTIR